MSSAGDWDRLPHGPSLFGKLPQKRDFIRLHHDYPAALAFDVWLRDGLAELAESDLRYGDAHVRFLYAAADVSLVGILCASRDRAGRTFPVSIFAPVPSSVATAHAADLWLASEPFLAASELLLAQSAELSLEELAPRIDALPAPKAHDLASVDRGDSPSSTFAEHGASSSFDCPAEDFQRVATWIRAAQRDHPGAVSAFWVVRGTREPQRVLLCLRQITAGLLMSITQGTIARGRGWVRL